MVLAKHPPCPDKAVFMQLSRFIDLAKRAQVTAQFFRRIQGNGIVITEASAPMGEKVLM
jgi:hypothetical protein